MSFAAQQSRPSRLELALLVFGFLSMYLPTYIAMDKQVWGIVGQGHGPVMLALVLWLVWQRLPRLASSMHGPTSLERSFGGMLVFLGAVMYVIGRSQNHFGLDSGSQLVVAAGLLLVYGGLPALKIMWFPLLFALTLVPLPGALVSTLTAPLKWAVSYCAEAILHSANYPVGRTGVMLTIGQYRLLVADACAGLNSVFALEAIGIFYMSIMNHGNKWRNIFLATLILPISFISNVLRVIALVLVTYYFGDEVGQSFVHEFAGIFLFVVATVLTIVTDSFLGMIMKDKVPAPKVKT